MSNTSFKCGDAVEVAFRGVVVKRTEVLGKADYEYVVRYELDEGKAVFKRMTQDELKPACGPRHSTAVAA